MPTIAFPQSALTFLAALEKHELAYLLRHSKCEFVARRGVMNNRDELVKVLSPPIFHEALKAQVATDHQRILEALIAAISLDKLPLISPRFIEFYSSTELNWGNDGDVLIPELMIHMSELIGVATGAMPISSVSDYYRARHRRIVEQLAEREIEYPNPFEDLWEWYRKWKSDLPKYEDRREYIRRMHAPVLSRLLAAGTLPAVAKREPTGWERVDRAREKARSSLYRARNEEDFQGVGLLCRELLISLGEAVFDSAIHPSPDGVQIGKADAARMIEAFILVVAPGDSYSKTRKHAKAACELAVELQHKRTADFKAAAICLEASSSVTQIIAILAGRHSPKSE